MMPMRGSLLINPESRRYLLPAAEEVVDDDVLDDELLDDELLDEELPLSEDFDELLSVEVDLLSADLASDFVSAELLAFLPESRLSLR